MPVKYNPFTGFFFIETDPVFIQRAGSIDSNTMLNAMRINVNNSLALQQMADGFIDNFQDQTGVNTGASSNQIFNSGSKFYNNTPPPISVIDQSTPVGDFDAQFGRTAIQDRAQTFTATETMSLHSIVVPLKKLNSPPNNLGISIRTVDGSNFPTGTILGSEEILTPAQLSTSYTDETIVFATQPSLTNGVKYAIVMVNKENVSAEDTTARWGWNLKNTTNPYSGGTNKFFDGIWKEQALNDHRFKILKEGTIATLTLIGANQTALSTPSDSKVLIRVANDVDTIVLADIGMQVSRDGGTTFSTVTLAKEGDFNTTETMYGGSVSLASQPTGTSMVYKATIINSKVGRIHGISLLWS